MKATVKIGQSEFKHRQPELRLVMPDGSTYRQVRAALHKLAAEAELLTPAREQWHIHISDDDCGGSGEHDGCVNWGADPVGYVYLELVDADEAEAARGSEMLQRVAVDANA